jgi:hypothetical protein
MSDQAAEEENARKFQQVMAAGTLGLALAGKAVEILGRHLDHEQLTRVNASGTVDFDCRIPAPDGAVFGAILDAANDCREVFDHRPPDERRWDALLQLMDLAALGMGIDIDSQLADTSGPQLLRWELLRPRSQ